jgi:hypothetical protein
MSDTELLQRALEGELSDDQREAFTDMLERVGRGGKLTDKQRSWVKAVLDEPEYENLVSAGKVPMGKPIETPAILRPENLPKRPPPRRSE